MSTTPIYVGIDGGGTRTRALAVDPAGIVVGRSEGRSINRNHHPREKAREALRDVLADCIPANGRLASLLIGTSGILTEADKEDVRQMALEIDAVAEADHVWVEHDTLVALLGGFGDTPGIVLIAGTGTACFGRNADGETWLASGWGALADDAGSAYWLAIEAIRAAVRAEDGRGLRTVLRDRCFDYLKLSTPRELLDRLHNPGIPREELAKMASLVIDAWKEGDPAGTIIAARAIEELALCVRTVRDRLFAGCDAVPAVLVGGLANSGRPFTPALTRALLQIGVVVSAPRFTPVEGAAREARRRSLASPGT